MDQDFRVFLVGFGSNTAVDHHLAYWPQAENVPEKHLKSMEPQREAWLTFPSSFRRSCAVTGVPFVFLNFSLSAVDAWWATATYRIDGSGDYSHFWVGMKNSVQSVFSEAQYCEITSSLLRNIKDVRSCARGGKTFCLIDAEKRTKC